MFSMFEQAYNESTTNPTFHANTPSSKMYGKDFAQHRSSVNLVDRFTIDLAKTVNFVAFSPFEKSYDILACSTQESVYIFRVLFSKNHEDSNGEIKFDYQLIHDYILGSKCTSIAFNNKTDFTLIKNNFLSFAVAGDDFCILIINQRFDEESTSKESAEQQCISGHSDYINDMAFDYSGDYFASTSDDCTCCLWSLEDKNKKISPDMKIQLSSPGSNVKWHKSEPNKLFVSEKKGLIRFYDTKSRVAVMSFDCNRYPLMSSDWCTENGLFIGCVSNKDLFFWDTSLTSLPMKVIKTTFEGLSEFEFYDSKLVAFRGRPNNFLRIKNFNNNQTFVEEEFISGCGISWNRKLPILAAGGPKGINIFKINFF